VTSLCLYEKYFFQIGRQMEIINSLAYYIPCSEGNLDRVKQLLSLKVSPDKYAIIGASRNGHLEVVKCLVSANIPIDTYAINVACEYGHLEIVKYLTSFQTPINVWAMTRAAENGHLQIVKHLISVNAEINIFAIKYAFHRDHLEVVKYLTATQYPEVPAEFSQYVPQLISPEEYLTLEHRIIEIIESSNRYILTDSDQKVYVYQK